MGANRQTQCNWLWPFMESGLCKGEGRVLMNNDGVVASLFSDNKCHTVFSNSWTQQGKNNDKLSELSEESRNMIDNGDDDDDDNDDNESSESEEGKEQEENDLQKEWVVEKIQNRKDRAGTIYYQTLWSSTEVTWENFSSFVDEGQISQAFLQFANQGDWITGLNSFTVDTLRKICNMIGKSRCM